VIQRPKQTRLDDAQKRRAFDDLYDSTSDQILKYCRRRSLRLEDAEDAAVETYLIAWQKIEDALQVESPTTWLYGVAFRVTANQRRGRDRFGRLVRKLSDIPRRRVAESAETVFLTTASTAEVHAALTTLTPLEQELIRLSAFEQLPHADIGPILGLSLASVRTRLYRARLRLQERLDEGDYRDTPKQPDTNRGTDSVNPIPSAGDMRQNPDHSGDQRERGEEP
jgi:RNA polymerase sigma-70 factor, ECF subfamily